MYAIAEQVRDWLAEGRQARVAQVVSTRGFSSRDPADALAWTDDDEVGALLDGVLMPRPDGDGLVEISVSDAEANAVGLSCGGAATVLAQDVSAYPVELWTRLADREPVCLVTATGTTTLYTPATIRDAGFDVAKLFGRGTSTTTVLDTDAGATAVVALWPVPRLVVVGDGLIADALVDAAALLGWQHEVVADVADAVAAAGRLHGSDAMVVLSHDRAVDGPALAAALDGSAGYVGALGSRRTQAARGEWLSEHGVPDEARGRIHGPAGLDIDAHTPGEIAVSIVAEIIGTRSASSGGALRDREGPVHGAGVHAPPPRYQRLTSN